MPRFINSLCVITIKQNTLIAVPKPNEGGCGICLRKYKPGKEVTLTLNNGCVYNAVHYSAVFFPVDPDNRVIMESQCNKYIA